MPIINTRKRKPTDLPTASPLDRLVSASAHALRTAPTDDASDASDAASTLSGDVPLRRMRFAARRVKRRRNALASDDDTDGHTEACSPRLEAEILALEATVNAMQGDSGRQQASTPLEAVQSIHAVVRNLQAALNEPVSAETLALHTRATLDDLWHQARQAVEHEMRAKLTFWKHKAETLRTDLHAAVEAAPEPFPAVVHEALNFVSTFYLLEMAPTQMRTEDPFRDMAIASANDKVARDAHELQVQRLRREQSPDESLANPLLLLSQHAVDLSNELRSERASDRRGNEGRPVRDRPVREVDAAVRSRATRLPREPMSTARPTAVSASKRRAPTASARAPAAPQITASGLNGDARRRLAMLVHEQLQTKTTAQSSTAPTPRTKPAPTAPMMRPALAPRPIAHAAPTGARASASASVATPAEPESDSDSDISHSGVGCATCGRNDSYSSLLLCDNGCEREFHTFCLQPPLEKIPEGDWYCPKCLAMENIEPGGQVYSCSASLCTKITGAKYCSVHRCKFDKCVNRNNFSGFCRRHEQANRERKGVRRASNTTTSPARVSLSAAFAVRPPALVPTTSARPPTPKTPQELMISMRQMGIWLPTNILPKTPAKSTPTQESAVI